MPRIKILVVDDTARDAAMIAHAVEFCLKLLKIDGEVVLASSESDAKMKVAEHRPQLLITDLFMPESAAGFDEDLNVQCDETEVPHGLRLLRAVDQGLRKLVTTFFWNYPGFSRYFVKLDEAGADGALPKDIFYLVGTLDKSVALRDATDFPPLRILLQALRVLIKEKPARDDVSVTVDTLHLRSLFDEASTWLTVFAGSLSDVRRSVSDPDPGKDTRRSDEVESPDNIGLHNSISAWMPKFIFVPAAADDQSYSRLMEELDGDDWAIHIQMPVPLASTLGRGQASYSWNGRTITAKYPMRRPTYKMIEKFLRPREHVVDERNMARLLVTLGFFSYWCHISAHQAARTVEDIARIMERTDRKYRGKEASKAKDLIRDDLEILNLMIQNAIRSQMKRGWYDILARPEMPRIIETKRDRETKVFFYWLNASLVILDEYEFRHRAAGL